MTQKCCAIYTPSHEIGLVVEIKMRPPHTHTHKHFTPQAWFGVAADVTPSLVVNCIYYRKSVHTEVCGFSRVTGTYCFATTNEIPFTSIVLGGGRNHKTSANKTKSLWMAGYHCCATAQLDWLLVHFPFIALHRHWGEFEEMIQKHITCIIFSLMDYDPCQAAIFVLYK